MWVEGAAQAPTCCSSLFLFICTNKQLTDMPHSETFVFSPALSCPDQTIHFAHATSAAASGREKTLRSDDDGPEITATEAKPARQTSSQQVSIHCFSQRTGDFIYYCLCNALEHYIARMSALKQEVPFTMTSSHPESSPQASWNLSLQINEW